MSSFWSPEYWLPRNVNWTDVPPNFYDLIYPIYFAVPILVLRVLYEAFVGLTVCHYFGMFPGPLKPQIQSHLFGGFSHFTRTKKILETFFRASSYSFLFAYGWYVLRNKSWLYDVKDCWIAYPYHKVDDSIWWYYMIETGFYYSLLISSLFDVRRSDFWQLVFHHIITIGLLSFSWTINFVRVGTLVLLCHDIADIPLEVGKLVKYTKRLHVLTNVMFVLFLSSWFVTRLGYFPFVLLWSAFTEAAQLIQPDYHIWSLQIPHAPRVIIVMLLLLLFLHVFWTVLILSIVVKTVRYGEASDVRSDSEEEPIEEARPKTKLLTKRRNMENGKKHD